MALGEGGEENAPLKGPAAHAQVMNTGDERQNPSPNTHTRPQLSRVKATPCCKVQCSDADCLDEVARYAKKLNGFLFKSDQNCINYVEVRGGGEGAQRGETRTTSCF